MTNYGTIATASSPTIANLKYTSGPSERLRVALGTQRPWNEMLDLKCFSIPSNLSEVVSRIVSNYRYYRMNYTIVSLFVILASLLWYPISLLVFVAMSFVWIRLCVLFDQPLVILGQTMAAPVISIGVAVVTVGLISLTGGLDGISNAVSVWAVVFLLHAVFRKTDDLYLDEEATGFLNSTAAVHVPPVQGSS